MGTFSNIIPSLWLSGNGLRFSSFRLRFALRPRLLRVNFGVPALLVTSRKRSPTHITGERLLTGVSAHMCRQMIAPAERPPAYVALKRLDTGVYPQVSVELVTSGKPTVAIRHRAEVQPRREQRRGPLGRRLFGPT